MPIRKTLLRIMLWSLGIAAVLGAITILTGGLGGIWRICGTTLLTAGAAGLMMPTSLLMDKPRSRPAGLLGMAAILIEFFLAVAMIWELVELLPGGGDPYGRAGATMFSLFLSAPPAMLFLGGRGHPRSRVAATLGLVLTAAAFSLSLAGAWLPDLTGTGYRWDWEWKWYGTSLATAGFGALMVACLVGVGGKEAAFGPPGMIVVRVIGALAALAALCIATAGIWYGLEGGHGTFTVIVSLAAVIAHANLCLTAPLSNGQRWVRVVTIASAMVAAFFIDLIAVGKGSEELFDTCVRLAAAAGLVASCGSLALLVLARLNRKMSDEAPVLKEIREITLICPGCNRKQTQPVGDSSCPTCHLRFHTRVEEPHCPQCDYLLFMLTSDRCPECGFSLRCDTSCNASLPNVEHQPIQQ